MSEPSWRDLDVAIPAGPWAWYDTDTDELVTSSEDRGPISLRTTWEKETDSTRISGVGPLPEFILPTVEANGYSYGEDDTTILAFIARARVEWPAAERKVELLEARNALLRQGVRPITDEDLDHFELGVQEGRSQMQPRIEELESQLRMVRDRSTVIVQEIDRLKVHP